MPFIPSSMALIKLSPSGLFMCGIIPCGLLFFVSVCGRGNKKTMAIMTGPFSGLSIFDLAHIAISSLCALDLAGSYVETYDPLRKNLGLPCATGITGIVNSIGVISLPFLPSQSQMDRTI